MIVGLGIQVSAAIQFRSGRLPFLVTGPVIVLGVIAVGNAMFAGYNGVAIMIAQAFAVLFLAGAAYEYWRARGESPVALNLMAFFNLATAICFALSLSVLVAEGERERSVGDVALASSEALGAMARRREVGQSGAGEVRRGHGGDLRFPRRGFAVAAARGRWGACGSKLGVPRFSGLSGAGGNCFSCFATDPAAGATAT